MTHFEKLCHRCICKPFRGNSLDGRITRGYLMERERCDDCRRQRFCCLFRPANPCAACGNHIQVEPAECRHDACKNTYCIICAPKHLPAANGGCCVAHDNVWRYHAAQHEQFFAALRRTG